MKKLSVLFPKSLVHLLVFILLGGVFLLSTSPASAQQTVQVNQGLMGFRIPNLADVLTFVVRAFFVIAGIAALFYLLLGGFAWVSSSGDKENIQKAQDKIQAAIIGVVLIVAVLAVIVTLEQIIFQKKLCFGVSCPANIPNLITNCTPDPDPTKPNKCCVSQATGWQPSLLNSTTKMYPDKMICCHDQGGGLPIKNDRDNSLCYSPIVGDSK